MKKTTSNDLKTLRKKKGLTCENIASSVGISKTYYWQIENNKRRLHYDTAKKIAKIFNLKPDDIFYKDN